MSDKSGSEQDVCRLGTPSAAATAGTCRCKLIQLCTYRIFAKLRVWSGWQADWHGVQRLSPVPPGFILHQSPNCSGPAEQKHFPSVCFSVSVWRRLERKAKRREPREVVSNRAGKDGLIFYHRDVSLFWLVCFLCVFFSCFFLKLFVSAPNLSKNPSMPMTHTDFKQVSANDYWIMLFDTIKGRHQNFIIVTEQSKVEVPKQGHGNSKRGHEMNLRGWRVLLIDRRHTHP